MNTFELQGLTFEALPFTKKNLDAFAKADDEAQDALLEAGSAEKIFDYYKAIFPKAYDGPHDKIDWDEVDGHEMEAAIMAFLPPSLRLYASLSGFST